jgi:glycosyltransferase involved in cell wall biosynthesis
LSVYHVGDEFSAFATSHTPTAQALERGALAKAQLVFAAAEQLAESKRQWQPWTFTIWNGIDPQLFDDSNSRGRLSDIEHIPRPRVAFVGVLDDWVDLELLVETATEMRDIQFLIVGPSRIPDSGLRGLNNVHLLGRRERYVIPELLRLCSASLVPFRRTTLTQRLVPLKVFEALAAGIRPVCTNFSIDLEALARANVLTVAASSEAFIAGVREAVADDLPETRSRLALYGRRQTWSARWQQMDAIIRHRLTDHHAQPPNGLSQGWAHSTL